MVCLHTLTQHCKKLSQDLLLKTTKLSVSNSRCVVSLTQCTDCLLEGKNETGILSKCLFFNFPARLSNMHN